MRLNLNVRIKFTFKTGVEQMFRSSEFVIKIASKIIRKINFFEILLFIKLNLFQSFQNTCNLNMKHIFVTLFVIPI